MTEKSFSGEHMPTEMTSKPSTYFSQITDFSTLASFPSFSVNYFFYAPGVVIGALGIGTNGLILYALYASKQHKKQMLIFNQNVLDLFTSLWLFITCVMGFLNVYHVGVVGYWLCMLITSETILYIGITGSRLNLMAVTVERYLKVVYPTWSRKRLRKWMKYSAAVFSWIGGTIYSPALTFPTSFVSEGRCYVILMWPSEAARKAWGIYAFVSFYAIPLAIFAFCYARILVAIRRQARVMAGHCAGTGTSDHRIQTSVIKTMISVTFFFAVSNFMLEMYYLLTTSGLFVADGVYYAAMFISFVYICTNQLRTWSAT